MNYSDQDQRLHSLVGKRVSIKRFDEVHEGILSYLGGVQTKMLDVRAGFPVSHQTWPAKCKWKLADREADYVFWGSDNWLITLK